MSKFLEVLLRIAIVVSFICIIVFVGVAIINNQAIAYESYNYIVSTRDKLSFKSTQSGIAENVYKVYKRDNGPSDRDAYANYINTAVIELNYGIDYFVDYLSVEDKLTKGEHDKLVTGYKKYAGSFNKVKEAYNSYLEAYAEAEYKDTHDPANSGYAIENVNAKSVYLIQTYMTCYKNGSSFFKVLAGIANEYIIPNLSYQTYKAQSHMIKVGFVDYSLDQMEMVLNEKLRNPSYPQYNPNNNPHARMFLTYNDKTYNSNYFSDKDLLTNSSFKEFTQNLNYLNIYEWAGNYNAYYNSLNDTLKTKAYNAKSFFDSNYS